MKQNLFPHKLVAPNEKMKRVHRDLGTFSLPESPAELEQQTFVLLFGHGICGEATHGAACGGFLKAVFPYHADHQPHVEGKDNVVGPISNNCLISIYEHYYQSMAAHLKRWIAIPGVKVIGWVTSPNVTERSARAAFGDHILESGILKWHYETSWEQCVKEFTKQGLSDYLINPNELKEGPYGGLDDQYYYSNNHASSEFCEPHIEEIFARVHAAIGLADPA
jgi:hypothetical protein